MRQTQGLDPAPVPGAIHALRKRLGLTQAQLAQKLLVCVNSVSRYELGIFAPRPQVLLILMTLARGHADERIFAAALAIAGFGSNFLASLPHSASIGLD